MGWGDLRPPSWVHLYAVEKEGQLDLAEIASYLREWLGPVTVEIRKDFFSHILERLEPKEREERVECLARGLASLKVRNPQEKAFFPPPLYGEIAYERERVGGGDGGGSGILYDGYRLQQLCWELLPPNETSLRHLHLIFNCQLFGTWDEDDLRYHARTHLCGFPALLSTTGIVVAPAKPKEFYFLKQQLSWRTMDDVALLDLKKRFEGRFIDYEDDRMTDVMKGYAMQALLSNVVGYPFCEDLDCRLFNAHWQEELIQAQLEGAYEFCPRHQEMLERLKGAAIRMKS